MPRTAIAACFEVAEKVYAFSTQASPTIDVRGLYYDFRRFLESELSFPAERLGYHNFETKILPKLELKHPEWNVYRDPRGTLLEPHTYRQIALGTRVTRDYLERVRNWESDGELPRGLSFRVDTMATIGPVNRFTAILLVEKDGGHEILRGAGTHHRFDVAIASSKGLSVVAIRELADELHQLYEVPVLVLHDFDFAGFNLVNTMRESNLRYRFRSGLEPVDLGLRLDHVHDPQWGLVSESCSYGGKGGAQLDPRPKLRAWGATEAEIAFLCETTEPPHKGKRVELNALGGRFVEFVETQLEGAGVEKLIPDGETLEAQYRRSLLLAQVNDRLDGIVAEERRAVLAEEVPEDLSEQITELFADEPDLSWDEAVNRLTEDHEMAEEDDEQ